MGNAFEFGEIRSQRTFRGTMVLLQRNIPALTQVQENFGSLEGRYSQEFFALLQEAVLTCCSSDGSIDHILAKIGVVGRISVLSMRDAIHSLLP